MSGPLLQFVFVIGLLSVPVMVCVAVRKRFRGIKGFAAAVIASAALMSGAVIVQWWCYDWYLERQIAPLDRNGDGLWTPDEEVTWTKEDRRLLSTYHGDGGRNVFAVFVWPALSVAYSIAVAAMYWLALAVKRRRAKPV